MLAACAGATPSPPRPEKGRIIKKNRRWPCVLTLRNQDFMPCCIPLSLGGTRRIAVCQTKIFSFYISFAFLVALGERRRSLARGGLLGDGTSARAYISCSDISFTHSQLGGLDQHHRFHSLYIRREMPHKRFHPAIRPFERTIPHVLTRSSQVVQHRDNHSESVDPPPSCLPLFHGSPVTLKQGSSRC